MVNIKFNKWSIFTFGIPLSVLFSNVKVMTVVGGKVQIGHIVMLLALLFCATSIKITRRKLQLAFMLLLFPLLPLYRINNTMEFVKTYVVFSLGIMFLCSLASICSKENNIYIVIQMLRNYCICLFILQIYGILQFIMANFFGSDCLFNIWGKWQFLCQIKSEMWGIRRASSLLYEPAWFGIMGCIEISILLSIYELFSTKTKKILLIFAFIGVCITLSTSAFVACLAIVLTYIIFSDRNDSFKKVIYIGTFLVVLFFLVEISDLFRNIIERIVFAKTENTSSYERMKVPLIMLKKTLMYYPIFGRGLGQAGDIDLVGKIGLYESPQNSIYAIGITFGMSIIPIIIFYANKAYRWLKISRIHMVLIVTLLFALYSSGGFLSMDYFIVYSILLSAGYVVNYYKKINSNSNQERERYE